MASTELSVIIEHANGGTTRLAVDENDGTRIPSQLAFSTSAAGGPATLQTSALRVLGKPGKERLFDTVKLVSRSGRVLWAGPLSQPGRNVAGDVTTMTINAVGWSSKLEDRKDARFLGIDRDPGSWRPMTYNRRLALNPSGSPGWSLQDFSTANGALTFNCGKPTWASNPGRPLVEANYDAGPLRVGKLIVSSFANAPGSQITSADPNWQLVAFDAADGDVATGISVGANQMPGLPGSFTRASSSKQLVGVSLYYGAAPAGGADASFEIDVKVAVVGDHGLPLRAAPDGTLGLLISDVIPYLLEQFAPSIKPGLIPPTVTVVPDLKFLAATTPGTMITTGLNLDGWLWTVNPDRTLDIAPWGSGRTWMVHATDPGTGIADEGAQAADSFNGIVVTFVDDLGISRCVGPPGSVADYHDPALMSSDAGNAAVAAGEWRLDVLDMGGFATLEIATIAGVVTLQDRQAAVRSGTITVDGYATDDQGRTAPVSEIVAGDYAIVPDDDPTPRRVVGTQYSHLPVPSNQLTCDNALQTGAAMLANLNSRMGGAA